MKHICRMASKPNNNISVFCLYFRREERDNRAQLASFSIFTDLYPSRGMCRKCATDVSRKVAKLCPIGRTRSWRYQVFYGVLILRIFHTRLPPVGEWQALQTSQRLPRWSIASFSTDFPYPCTFEYTRRVTITGVTLALKINHVVRTVGELDNVLVVKMAEYDDKGMQEVTAAGLGCSFSCFRSSSLH